MRSYKNDIIMLYFYDKTPISILYTDQEMLDVLTSFIDSYDDDTVTFEQISTYLISKADKDSKLDKLPEAKYNSIILTDKDGQRLSRMLWELIFQRKIYLNFYKNPYGNIKQADFVFGLIK